MATVMNMHWPEVSMKQYEETRRQVAWETDVPKGAKFHVAWFAGDGLHVMDIWESQADFEGFVKDRLMPAVMRLGIQGQPKVQFESAHAIFAPNIATKWVELATTADLALNAVFRAWLCGCTFPAIRKSEASGNTA